jgi:hypothetical protein
MDAVLRVYVTLNIAYERYSAGGKRRPYRSWTPFGKWRKTSISLRDAVWQAALASLSLREGVCGRPETSMSLREDAGG